MLLVTAALQSLAAPPVTVEVQAGHASRNVEVAWSADGSTLASYSDMDGRIVWWDVMRGRQVKAFQTTRRTPDNQVHFDLSDDGALLAWADTPPRGQGMNVHVVDLRTGADVRTVRLDDGDPRWLAFSADGGRVAVSDIRNTWVIDPRSGSVLEAREGTGRAAHPQLTWLYLANRKLLHKDAERWHDLGMSDARLAFHPDGTRLYAVDDLGMRVRAWQLQADGQITELALPESPTLAPAASPTRRSRAWWTVSRRSRSS